MLKEGRTRRKDPVQESIVSKKDEINDRTSKLIRLLIDTKKAWNGKPSPLLGINDKTKITDPLRQEIFSAEDRIKQEINSIFSKLEEIGSDQENYSSSKRAELMDLILKTGSNPLTRIWSHIKAPFLSDSNKWIRLKMLRGAADSVERIKDIQEALLSRDKNSKTMAFHLIKSLYTNAEATYLKTLEKALEEYSNEVNEKAKEIIDTRKLENKETSRQKAVQERKQEREERDNKIYERQLYQQAEKALEKEERTRQRRLFLDNINEIDENSSYVYFNTRRAVLSGKRTYARFQKVFQAFCEDWERYGEEKALQIWTGKISLTKDKDEDPQSVGSLIPPEQRFTPTDRFPTQEELEGDDSVAEPEQTALQQTFQTTNNNLTELQKAKNIIENNREEVLKGGKNYFKEKNIHFSSDEDILNSLISALRAMSLKTILEEWSLIEDQNGNVKYLPKEDLQLTEEQIKGPPKREHDKPVEKEDKPAEKEDKPAETESPQAPALQNKRNYNWNAYRENIFKRLKENILPLITDGFLKQNRILINYRQECFSKIKPLVSDTPEQTKRLLVIHTIENEIAKLVGLAIQINKTEIDKNTKIDEKYFKQASNEYLKTGFSLVFEKLLAWEEDILRPFKGAIEPKDESHDEEEEDDDDSYGDEDDDDINDVTNPLSRGLKRLKTKILPYKDKYLVIEADEKLSQLRQSLNDFMNVLETSYNISYILSNYEKVLSDMADVFSSMIDVAIDFNAAYKIEKANKKLENKRVLQEPVSITDISEMRRFEKQLRDNLSEIYSLKDNENILSEEI